MFQKSTLMRCFPNRYTVCFGWGEKLNIYLENENMLDIVLPMASSSIRFAILDSKVTQQNIFSKAATYCLGREENPISTTK